MAFLLTLCYVLLIYLAPAEVIPELAPLRLQLCLFFLAALASAPALFAEAPFGRGPQPYLMSGFMAAIVFSLVMRGWLGGVLPAVSSFLPAAGAFFLLLLNVRTTRQLKSLQVGLIAVAVLLVIRGTIAYHSGASPSVWVMVQHLGEGDLFVRRLRALGILNDPNDLAQFLLMMVPLVLLNWNPGELIQSLPLVGVPVAILGYGIFLTRSRGALVGIAVVVAVAFQKRIGRLAGALMALPVALALIAMNFAGGREVSLEGGVDRIDIWSDGLALVKQSPLWGVGYGLFTEYNSHTAHNSFLLCAAELGLVGYLVWLAFFVVALWQLGSILSAPRDQPALPAVEAHARALRLCLWAYLSTAWFLSRVYMATPYVVLGMAGALAQIDVQRRQVLLLPEARVWMRRTAFVGFGLLLGLYVLVRIGHRA
jgi:putative inorganic carbon (HCO3(-)) transporter